MLGPAHRSAPVLAEGADAEEPTAPPHQHHGGYGRPELWMKQYPEFAQSFEDVDLLSADLDEHSRRGRYTTKWARPQHTRAEYESGRNQKFLLPQQQPGAAGTSTCAPPAWPDEGETCTARPGRCGDGNNRNAR